MFLYSDSRAWSSNVLEGTLESVGICQNSPNQPSKERQNVSLAQGGLIISESSAPPSVFLPRVSVASPSRVIVPAKTPPYIGRYVAPCEYDK